MYGGNISVPPTHWLYIASSTNTNAGNISLLMVNNQVEPLLIGCTGLSGVVVNKKRQLFDFLQAYRGFLATLNRARNLQICLHNSTLHSIVH
jgi:hypothetical protein